MHYFGLQGSVIHTTSAASLCGGVLGGSSVWANMTMADAKGCLDSACTTLDSKAPSFTPLARHRYVVASLGEVVCGPT